MRWKWILILTVGLFAVAGSGKKEERPATSREVAPPLPSGRIAAVHFVGGVNASADTNAAFLKRIWLLPETQVLKEQTLNKLARVPYKLWNQRVRMGTNDFAPLFRPLLDDLLRAESWLEVSGETNPTPDCVLAVRLDEARAELWRTNLSAALSTWTHLSASEINSEGASGWEIKKHHAPNLIRFVRVGDWVVLGAGQDKILLADELIARIKAGGRPCPAENENWLSAEWDWAWLSKHLPVGVEIPKISRARATLGGKDMDLRARVVMARDEPFDWKPETWRIPTNIIRAPLVGFTAVRGIGDWLSRWKMNEAFKTDPMPDQFYIWTLKGVPLQTYLAASVNDASNALEQLAPRLIGLNTNLPVRLVGGQIGWNTNRTVLKWAGLPFIIPFIEPVREPNGDFLFAGVFPNSFRRAPLPAGLLGQIVGRTNLVFYSWEITAERILGVENISQLFLLLARHQQLDSKSAAGQWLATVGPGIGNTITEMTLTGPDELTLVRKSPVGLTAFELVMLANWVESPDFPLGGFQLMPRPARPVRPRPAATAPPQ